MSLLVDAPALVAIEGEGDLLRVRAALRSAARNVGLSLTAETKLVTAGSELARNIVRYATSGEGTATIDHQVNTNGSPGVRARFADHGPGIADLDAAMRDGFSSAGSLGLGLPGSRRLVDDFTIDTDAGVGTTVVIVQWKR